jgi:phthalate 4,5-cis-dihydrodiol dehydrogenase
MNEPVRLGVIGLGRAFTLMLPTFSRHPLIKLAAAFDPRADARTRFAVDFAARSYEDVAGLCADPDVQAIYVASPHQFHVEHVRCAAAAGKHVLVEKPMALTIADCTAMISAADAAGVHLLVGHSHSFDAQYLQARTLIAEGTFGRVRMINALNFTDFLYRPRRPEELDTEKGGGVVFSQAAHQVDVVRLLANAPARSVRALTGNWDPSRPTEGAYNAQIRFDGGAFASLTYSGYGHFDTDVFQGWMGELGKARDPSSYGGARRALATVSTTAEEVALKERRAYGPSGRDAFSADGQFSHNHFGLFVVSCDRGDLCPSPEGVTIYGDLDRSLDPLPPPVVPRAEVAEELHAAVYGSVAPLHSGRWGRATLEICLAILSSARNGGEVELQYQI